MKNSIYVFLMLNFVNQANSQVDFKNSTWMLNVDFGTFYTNRFDFVRFNNQDEIEYLNGKGELISKDHLIFDKEGNCKIEGSPSFKGFEFINPKEINLVYEAEFTENDEYKGIRDMKLNLTLLTPTRIKISKGEIARIMADSEWKLIQPTGEKNTFTKFTEWHDISEAEIEKVNQVSSEFRKYKKTYHLIKIGETVMIVQQKLNLVYSKVMISEFLDDKIIILNHYKDNEEIILERIN